MEERAVENDPAEIRHFETGYIPAPDNFLFIDIVLFRQLLAKCFEVIGVKARRGQIDKLLNAQPWVLHYTDRNNGCRVLSETKVVEHSHEMRTAISLANKGYEILFAPKGMFSRNEKRFDIYIIKDHVILQADLKSISSKNPDTISNRIRGGSAQATRVVVEINSDVEKRVLIDGLRMGVKNKELKEIFLFYRNYFYVLPVSLIESKHIYNTIK